MEASGSNGPDGVKTFRGTSLEELLPQIRAELGPDAIVLRRREGTAGGVKGFFARPYVEVDARAPTAEERPLEIRSDRATAEGLSSPAVQALFEQATPFADALAAAAREAGPQNDFFSATVSDDQSRVESPVSFEEDFFDPANISGSAGLYGPQPNQDAIRRAVPKPPPEPEAVAEPVVEAPPDVAEDEDTPPAFAFDAPSGFAIPDVPRPARGPRPRRLPHPGRPAPARGRGPGAAAPRPPGGRGRRRAAAGRRRPQPGAGRR